MAERLASDRMFAVIVLGGIALATSVAACGGNVVVDGAASGAGGGKHGHGGAGGISTSTGFPQEGPGPTTGGFGGFGGFGAGGGIVDAGTDGFPQETDQAPDAGQSSSTGFPNEAP